MSLRGRQLLLHCLAQEELACPLKMVLYSSELENMKEICFMSFYFKVALATK